MCSFKSRMRTLHSEEISELGKLLLKIVFYFQPTSYLFLQWTRVLLNGRHPQVIKCKMTSILYFYEFGMVPVQM